VAVGLTALGLLASSYITSPDFEKADKVKGYKYFESAAFLPSLVMVFAIMPFGAVVSFIALYSIERGIENIGFFFTIYALTLLFARPFSGMLADKYGYHKVLVPGIFVMSVGMYIISIADNPLLFAVAAIVFGLGIGFVIPSLQSLAVKNVPPNRRGAANGTFFSSFDIGIGLGSLAWGVIAHYFGYSIMYLITIIPAMIGLAIFLKYYKKQDKDEQIKKTV
jgi:MFS family permease